VIGPSAASPGSQEISSAASVSMQQMTSSGEQAAPHPTAPQSPAACAISEAVGASAEERVSRAA
jgi:hypothetical protein